MRKFTSLILVTGIAFYLVSMAVLPAGSRTPIQLESVGAEILERTPSEAGAANAVTAVVVQFRGLDTLGEVTVLFVSALGVALLAGALRDGGLRDVFRDDGGFVLQVGSRVLLPFIVLVGAYIVIHGHLSPGGGFPGGVLIATAVFVVFLTSARPTVPGGILSVLEGAAGLGFVLLGLLGLVQSGSFLANTLPRGEFGTVFSAGLIPLIYGVVGVKVASELTNVIAELAGDEAAKQTDSLESEVKS